MQKVIRSAEIFPSRHLSFPPYSTELLLFTNLCSVSSLEQRQTVPRHRSNVVFGNQSYLSPISAHSLIGTIEAHTLYKFFSDT